MALTDENGGMNATMLMQPAYGIPYGGGFGGGYGMGGDFMSWILLLLVLGGGWGGFGGFGMGGMMGAGMLGMDCGFGLYPWLNNSEHISDGFRDQQLSTQVNGIQNAITSGFGDVQLGIAGVNQNICQTGNGITAAINAAQNATAQQLYSNEIASLNRSFAEQTANMQGFNGVQTGLSDIRYTTAKEACDTRSQAAMNTRDIVDAIRGGDQMIMDKLCALELDGVKGQLAQAQRENTALQNAVNMATMQASQVQQTSDIINGTYTRLSQCPVNSTPVYGNQPIFTCPQQVNSGCGCGGNF